MRNCYTLYSISWGIVAHRAQGAKEAKELQVPSFKLLVSSSEFLVKVGANQQSTVSHERSVKRGEGEEFQVPSF